MKKDNFMISKYLRISRTAAKRFFGAACFFGVLMISASLSFATQNEYGGNGGSLTISNPCNDSSMNDKNYFLNTCTPACGSSADIIVNDTDSNGGQVEAISIQAGGSGVQLGTADGTTTSFSGTVPVTEGLNVIYANDQDNSAGTGNYDDIVIQSSGGSSGFSLVEVDGGKFNDYNNGVLLCGESVNEYISCLVGSGTGPFSYSESEDNYVNDIEVDPNSNSEDVNETLTVENGAVKTALPDISAINPPCFFDNPSFFLDHPSGETNTIKQSMIILVSDSSSPPIVTTLTFHNCSTRVHTISFTPPSKNRSDITTTHTVSGPSVYPGAGFSGSCGPESCPD